jgi:hypothetical protein
MLADVAVDNASLSCPPSASEHASELQMAQIDPLLRPFSIQGSYRSTVDSVTACSHRGTSLTSRSVQASPPCPALRSHATPPREGVAYKLARARAHGPLIFAREHAPLPALFPSRHPSFTLSWLEALYTLCQRRCRGCRTFRGRYALMLIAEKREAQGRLLGFGGWHSSLARAARRASLICASLFSVPEGQNIVSPASS